ncbi:hypothetical protein T492DRAFT_990001 [Pavlovales sp. CCMP2436]|nr:hypothetical protein T492DRAFT_990001 [Pavlovales sp. CCMP2436]|mmetsp:Transcript_15447/g.39183  ORF Transcript_15447/g.39183 Transcript_15447/m.39183 type:complete len:274 (+) Transcript_15447:95-916(+)
MALPQWGKKKRPTRPAVSAVAAPTTKRSAFVLGVSKYGLGAILALLVVVDAVALLVFIVSSANLHRAADAIAFEVRGNSTLAVGNTSSYGAELSRDDKQKLAGAKELSVLAAITAALAVWLAVIDLLTIIAARTTGSRTRLEIASSMALKVTTYLLLPPQALFLLCMSLVVLARGKRVREIMCARNDDELSGCFPAVPILAGFCAILGLLSLLRIVVTLKFNSTVKTSLVHYAEMSELETAAETAAREDRMAVIGAKHQALRDKYAAKAMTRT